MKDDKHYINLTAKYATVLSGGSGHIAINTDDNFIITKMKMHVENASYDKVLAQVKIDNNNFISSRMVNCEVLKEMTFNIPQQIGRNSIITIDIQNDDTVTAKIPVMFEGYKNAYTYNFNTKSIEEKIIQFGDLITVPAQDTKVEDILINKNTVIYKMYLEGDSDIDLSIMLTDERYNIFYDYVNSKLIDTPHKLFAEPENPLIKDESLYAPIFLYEGNILRVSMRNKTATPKDLNVVLIGIAEK